MKTVAVLVLWSVLALTHGQVPDLEVTQMADPSPEEYALLDGLPGLDFVGFGFDARFDTADTGLQLPLFSFSYTKDKAYAYPTFRQLLYRVPDEVYVRNIAYTEATAYLYNTVDDYTTALSLDFGISYTEEESLSVANLSCVTTGNETESNTECEETGRNTNSKMFSGGATVNYLRNTFEEQEVYIVENDERTQLYHIFLDKRFIRPEVRQDLRDLSDVTMQTVEGTRMYFRFIEKYGTHYVTSASMGGDVKMTSTIAKSVSRVGDTFSAGVTFGNAKSTVTTTEALDQANRNFQQQLSGSVQFGLENVDETINFQSTSQWRLLGGDSNLVNLLDSSDASTTIKTWKSTITMNPVPVAYRLRDISTLADDEELRDRIAAAVQLYLQYDTRDILRVENFDGLAIPVFTAFPDAPLPETPDTAF